jgi:hypothetical protein
MDAPSIDGSTPQYSAATEVGAVNSTARSPLEGLPIKSAVPEPLGGLHPVNRLSRELKQPDRRCDQAATKNLGERYRRGNTRVGLFGGHISGTRARDSNG